MKHDSARAYIRNRIVFLCIILLIAVVTARFLFPQGEPTIQRVQATVIEINQGEGESLRTGVSTTLTTARVQLADGTETRVMISGSGLQPGQSIQLIEQRFPDGTLRYSFPRAEL
ncbi:MAG: hypothetical protein HLUCCX14_12070 [Marinobacter excellens HL-55]|uniref:Uncharacterized protein n=1 Tax=Marinobacter excellens HL-55 TaxID=1305731 RepID=A0A0P8B391_9GAMM|nr:MAG: hypothetical protein HLUCCX14_12070 [Marinobacter excellens HL-55]